MNEEDIINMARQAGMEQDGEMVYSFQNSDKDQDVRLVDLKAFAELVAAAERKACAHMCDEFGLSHIGVALMFRGKHGD